MSDYNTQYFYNSNAHALRYDPYATFQHGFAMNPLPDRQPTPTYQPNLPHIYPYSRPNPAWIQNPPGSQLPGQAARCRTFPFCTFLNCKIQSQ